MASSYDVFLAYNSSDKPQVQRIHDFLKAQGLEVFFDEESIAPGQVIQVILQSALRESRVLVACIGPEGTGVWQQVEVQVALNQSVTKGMLVVPVLLPGAKMLDGSTFLNQYKAVVMAESENPLEDILWGITQKKPTPDPPDPPDPQDPQDPSPARTDSFPPDESQKAITSRIDDLIKLLAGYNLSFFVGMNTAPPEEECLPSSYQISKELMSELGLLAPDQETLLLPVDLAGDYYVSGKSEQGLEQAIRNLLEQHKKKIASPHRRIVQILEALESWREQRSQSGRGLVTHPHLVVTTNVDLMMERAFLRSGLAFTRIVQHADPRNVTITEYRPQIGDREIRLIPSGASVAKSDIEGLDELIANAPPFEPGAPLDLDYSILKREELQRSTGSESSWEDFKRDWEDPDLPLYTWPLRHLRGPVLFKFLGSRDITDSCVIGRGQLFDLTECLQPLSQQQRGSQTSPIFRQIRAIVQNGPNLFIGHGYLDPYFRLICDTLLKDASRANRFLIQQPPITKSQQRDRRVEMLLWQQLGESMPDRTRVRRVQYDPLDFLKILWSKVKPLAQAGVPR